MYSMTGYGRADYCENGITLTVELKTVNNRNFDLNCKIPRSFIALEDTIRKTVASYVKRGRIDLFVNFSDTRESSTNIEVNLEKAVSYYSASKEIAKALGLENDYTVANVMKAPDVIVDGASADLTEIKDIVSLIENGEMPLKVTHNDTKLNNVLLNAETLEGLAVIDLDTVMPGSVCYDFGDSIRFGCNSSYEDEADLSKVYFKMDMFEAYVEGYLSMMTDITDVEKEHLVDGAILMTFECGIRFLSDFLDGDTYFKTTKENHNLLRCRTQFKLVSEMEKNRELMLEIVRKH